MVIFTLFGVFTRDDWKKHVPEPKPEMDYCHENVDQIREIPVPRITDRALINVHTETDSIVRYDGE